MAEREEKQLEAFKNAIAVPQQMAQTMSELLPSFTFLLLNGNKNALSDSIMAAQNAIACIRASIINVKINLKYVDDELYDIEEVPELDKNKRHNIEVVVDRIVKKEGIETRLNDSLEIALNLADGTCIIKHGDKKDLFSSHQACPTRGTHNSECLIHGRCQFSIGSRSLWP